MDVQLAETQAKTRRTVRELAGREIVPIAAQIDEDGRFPRQVFRKMAEAGLFGILVPQIHGGAGGNRLDLVLAVEEIAAASASIASGYVKSTGAAYLIQTFGSNEQRDRYLPALALGEMLGAVAGAEPSGGTNWQTTLRTRAVPRGDVYLVNGAKCFTSNAGEADIYVVVARTDDTKGPEGISALIVERDTPGFSVGTLEDKFGLRGDPTGELHFDDCRVPKENLLGQEGDARGILGALGSLDCVAQAAMCTGIARAALEACIEYANERIVIQPRTIADLENVQRAVADMAVAVEAARLLTHRAALSDKRPDPLTFLAATFGNQVAMRVTGEAVTLHGGYGCTRDFRVGRYFRDAKTLSLQKTSDHVRAMAGRMLLVQLGTNDALVAAA